MTKLLEKLDAKGKYAALKKVNSFIDNPSIHVGFFSTGIISNDITIGATIEMTTSLLTSNVAKIETTEKSNEYLIDTCNSTYLLTFFETKEAGENKTEVAESNGSNITPFAKDSYMANFLKRS